MIGRFIQWAKEKVTGKKPQISRGQVLSARPLRNPKVEWTKEQKDEAGSRPVALLQIPRRSDKLGNAMARVFRLPDTRKLELDEIGSDVWEMCDGDTTVEEITKALTVQYRLNRRQAETSVTAYLRMLAERRLIVLKATRETASGSPTKAARSGRSGKGAGRSTAKRHKQA
ncbi:MAG: hypothetical protein OHK0029_03750 [Armatimonadaceae bacterium]